MELISFGVRNFPRFALACALGSALCSLSVPSHAASTTLTISGTPPASVTLSNEYRFQPTWKDTIISAYKFNITNKPSWATFDEWTGLLAGRPNRADVGTYSGIVIRLTNWNSYVTLPAFAITVRPAQAADTAPTISGRAAPTATVGTAYTFTPGASDTNNKTLTFSIQNKPAWAAFNTSSGTLSGTPTAADVGTFANVQISVSDGVTSAALPAFTVTVNQIATGSATLDWTPPTENTDGTALTNLAGYNVYYGTSPGSLAQVIKLTNPGVTSYVVPSLGSGTWYFAVTSVSWGGSESAQSGTVSTTIL